MKYFLEAKDTGKKTKITQQEALYYLTKGYKDPQYVLENADRLFGNRIALTFNYLVLKK